MISRDEVYEYFKELDTDGSGYIGLAEVEATENTFGLPMALYRGKLTCYVKRS